jgi:hypothetical protein
VKPLEAGDLLDRVAYERERPETLKQMIEFKRARRIQVGDRLTFVFENRETVRFQIQEMLRTERIVEPDKIQAELDVYNELIPNQDRLSATLMIEIVDRSEIKSELDRLIGIDEYVYLDIGDRTVTATFDSKQFEEDRIAAVQYVRFTLGPELAARFCDPSIPVRLRLDHPNYRHETPIEGASRASLAGDLEK